MLTGVPYFFVFLCLLPVVAFLYAAVGHGGASGYLALMSIFSLSFETIKPTALLLNLFVAGVSFYHYYKGGYFNPRLFFIFALSSIPMSFIGGTISIDTVLYRQILGGFLSFAILRMCFSLSKKEEKKVAPKMVIGLIIGGMIGFFSGLIGIGGGIILSPIILLLHWGKAKEAATVSSLFIWVNSLAGLFGQLSIGAHLSEITFLMVGLVLVGGFIGSYFGSKRMSHRGVKYILVVVLVTAVVKLIFLP